MFGRKKKDNKISEQVAESQVATLLDYYDVDIEVLPDEVEKAVEYALTKLQRAIMSGKLEIIENTVDDSIDIEQTTRAGNKILYKEVTGQSKSSLKKTDEKDHYGRIYALLGAISGEGKDVIMALKGPDLVIAENVGVVLLNV